MAPVRATTARQRVEALLGPGVAIGWVLSDPQPVDGGWRVRLIDEARPLMSIEVWDFNLERAATILAEEIRRRRRRGASRRPENR